MAFSTKASLGKFLRDLDRFAAEAAIKAPTDRRNKIAIFLLERVVDVTPVDTGRARGNWQVTVGAPAEGEVKGTDKRGGSTVSKGAAKILSLPLDDTYITNNVHYITYLDKGTMAHDTPKTGSPDRRKKRRGKFFVKGGFSLQAPQGIVDISIQEARSVFGF
jgi:hypothetical protein